MREDISVTNTGASSFHVKPNSHVLFSISLIQDEQPDAQTGEEFDQMANDIMANPNVSEVTLLPVDTLQRFRFMLKDENLTEDDAIAKTKELYNNFLERNAAKIDEMRQRWPGKFNIIEWDDYRNIDDFKQKFENIEKSYEANKKFKNAVNKCLKIFVVKYQKMLGEKYNGERAWDFMKKYILEEVTFMVIAANDSLKNFQYEYYQGIRNAAMQCAYNMFVKYKNRNRMEEIIRPKLLEINQENESILNGNRSVFFAPQHDKNQKLDLLAGSLCLIVKEEAEKLHKHTGLDPEKAIVYFFTAFMRSAVNELPLEYKEKYYNGQSTTVEVSFSPKQTSISYQ